MCLQTVAIKLNLVLVQSTYIRMWFLLRQSRNNICDPQHPRCYLMNMMPVLSKILQKKLLTHFDKIDIEQNVYK